MMVAGYEHEGFVIPEQEAKDYIWKQARSNEEEKNMVTRIYVGCIYRKSKI